MKLRFTVPLLASGIFLAAIPAGSQPLPVSIAPGATFTFERTVSGPRMSTFHETITVNVLRVSGHGYTAHVTYNVPGTAPVSKNIRDDETGWTFVDGAPRPHDLLEVDPARYCALPKQMSKGLSWDCDARTVWHTWPAGRVHVTISRVSTSELELTSFGTAPVHSEVSIDDETGKPVNTELHTRWKADAEFRNGVLFRETLWVTRKIHVGSQILPFTTTTTIVRK